MAKGKGGYELSFADLRQEAVVTFLLASLRVKGHLESLCHTKGISLSQFNIMRILKGVYPGAHPRSEIRKRMIEKSDVTRLIDRLEQMGLVQRVAGTQDKRHSMTVITTEGLAFLTDLSAQFEIAHLHLTESFTENEMKTLVALVKKFPK